MALYDTDYWTQRVIATFPRVWGADTAFKPGGSFYNLVYQTAGLTLQYVKSQISYLQLQTRIATATDTNLEAIATDFFGPNNLPRLLVLDSRGLNLIPESDAVYSARIRDNIFGPKNTVAAIQKVVQAYMTTQYISEVVPTAILFGLDTAGGLGTRGGLDGQASSIPQLPTVYVFDRKSDPKQSAIVGLTSSQFCILFSYSGLTQYGFFIGRAHLTRNDYLVNSAIQIIDPLTSNLDAVVRATKAVGTVPIYADNRVGA